MTEVDNVIIPPERLEAKRREREARRDAWPPPSPILGEDYEAACIAFNHEKERKR